MSRTAGSVSPVKKISPRSATPEKVKNKIAALLSFDQPPSAYLTAFFADLAQADLDLFSAGDRARIAASIWTLATVRAPGEAKVRVYNPTREADGWTVDHTVIEVVSDDMPFLVDSVTGILQYAGYAVHVSIHPMLRVVRDAQGRAKPYGAEGGKVESFMHFQIDHCLDPAQLESIERDVRSTMADVAAAVEDWRAMRDRLTQTATTLTGPSGKAPDYDTEDVGEVRAFLNWLGEDNFTFLGARDIAFKEVAEGVAIKIVKGSGLGVLRNDDLRMFGGLRDSDGQRAPILRQYVRKGHLLFIAKTNAITRVHRVLPMDAIFIRSFDDQGRVTSERLFVGLFTSQAYAQTPMTIPFLRRKIAGVVARTGFVPESHDGRGLMHVLNTYPHDELFQIGERSLYENALGIVQLQERARVALFTRLDPFRRYVTCLIYVPRDRYDSALRVRIQAFLEQAYQGKAQNWDVRIDSGRLARAFVTLQLSPGIEIPDAAKVEEQLREMCRTWGGLLRDMLVAAHGEAEALVLLRRYGDAFPASYRDATPPEQAVRDIAVLEKLRAAPRFTAALDRTAQGDFHLKLFNCGQPLLLSATLPLLENMGLRIDYMGGPYEVKAACGAVYVHEFVGRTSFEMDAPFETIAPLFADAFERIWSGEIENDAFNALTLRAGLAWRPIVVLRSFARYLKQLRIPYGREMIAGTFSSYPSIARHIVDMFMTRHDPAFKGDRGAASRKLEAAVAAELALVTTIEDDRIVRRYLNLIASSLRTNYFQTDAAGQPKPYLAIKFDSRAVEFMPLPKPMYEIFVYSAATEGVHLRGGKVARGGIRWSDRREDFRAEILGLMKAQMVKNTVIVPVGSKGGFIVKRPPADPEKFMAEGIACYKTLIRGLLDLTDNRVGGKIVPPKAVVRHDGDDPYLVVAADKGTAKFSDIANGLSQDYGFWLDDAFASGGSAGYDHKGMGITARGAWEAAKRHFRELGKDIQKEEFTCIGVGDMSGDVFGNGMLLSPHTLLLGAFDHRHIFCDPTPDAAKSLAERKRLFALPRSSWDDYDRKAISKGGGVFARTLKAIPLSPEMKRAYGVSADSLSPVELIQAMLLAEVEMIYFGGIGTYVKAAHEVNEAVGDRANDALRVDGSALRAKIVCEGANLGMTQAGRIDYALKGGRLNTDAIDNSAGVDTSDHEVNIKILLGRPVSRGQMTVPARNKVLASMTADVARHVLRDNYLQTQALSLAQTRAAELLPAHARCIQLLEKAGLLNRKVEGLPDDVEISDRARAGLGLTRPELAVLMGYVKIWLYQGVLDTKLPDDPALNEAVTGYFPPRLQRDFAADIDKHQLRAEIAATVLINDAVNYTGLHPILLLAERVGVETAVRAYLTARDALALPALWGRIEALDAKVAAALQSRLMLATQAALVPAMEALVADPAALVRLERGVKTLRGGVEAVAAWLRAHAEALDEATQATARDFTAGGVEAKLALEVAILPKCVAALGLADKAAKQKPEAVGALAALFFGLENRLEIGWLRRAAAGAGLTSWQREALDKALTALEAHHHRLAADLSASMARLKGKAALSGTEAVAAWAEREAEALRPYDALIAEAKAAGGADLALILLANERLATLSIGHG